MSVIQRYTGIISYKGFSVARFMVVLGLVIQILGLARIIFLDVGLRNWIDSIQRGFGPSIAASVVFLACLALLLPALRGRKWAVMTTLPVQLLLVMTGMPFFLDSLPRPGVVGFGDWFSYTTLTLAGIVAFGFGILATLEVTGRVASVGFRTTGGVTRTGGILGAIGFAWLGIVILGVTVASGPPSGTTFAQPPDEILQVVMENNRFHPETIDLAAGKTTAIFLVNKDDFAHSFDIDALNVHVYVPALATVVTMVKPTAEGRMPLYCGVADHRQAGMVGAIASR